MASLDAAGPSPQTRTAALSPATLRRLLTAALVLGFLVLVAAAGAAAWLVSRDRDFTGWVNHTYVVERHLSRFSTAFETAEAARRGYFLTRDPRYLATYQTTASELPRVIEQIQALTADNPRQQANAALLDQLLTRKLNLLEASIQAMQASPGGAAPSIAADQDTVDAIRARTALMVAEENRLLQMRTDLQGQNAETLLATVLATGVLLTALAAGSVILVRRYAADLDRSQSALKALNEGLEGAVRERTSDLVRANQEIQRFAYIVSHDLRSPLVNVMGFTSELEVSLKSLRAAFAPVEVGPGHGPGGGFGQGAGGTTGESVMREARAAVETDIPEAIGFIRSSTQKMDRLINAILKLSREGRRTLNPEPIDTEALFAGIVASLRHVTEDRGAEISIQRPLPPLVSDRLALEQVFSNIIENAVKYAKAGRAGRVEVRGREADLGLVFEVKDNGRGIDLRDQERIFDLFRRSGPQDQPGEGIGLAHVRALAYRLGGQITVDSALDQGATFRLSLPRVLSRDQDAEA